MTSVKTRVKLYKAIKTNNFDKFLKYIYKMTNINDVIYSSVCFYTILGTPLFFACKYKRPDMVQELIQNNASININAGHLNTDYPQKPLDMTLMNNDITTFKILVNAGIPIIVSRKFFRSTLMNSTQFAARYAGSELLDYYFSKFGTEDINSFAKKHHDYYNNNFNKFLTPLMIACCLGKLDKVKILIKYGAKINITANKYTAMRLAEINKRFEIVNYLESL